jgi:GTP cyclohydrolase I
MDMEDSMIAAQGLEHSITKVSWGECYAAAENLWDRHAKNPPRYLYGVPRGGCIAALLVQLKAAQRGDVDIPTLIDSPGPDTLVIDDLVDSGATLARFGGFPVDALFRKSCSPANVAPHAILTKGWVTFPFELEEGTGGEDIVVRLLQYIGEDPTRDGLIETPKRVLKAWRDLTIGYSQDPKVILSKTFEQPHDELILLKGVRFTSCCEHHLLPFTGVAAIGYIPSASGGVVGISKLARVLECFARRLQIQERLAQQVADAITDALAPLGVGVVIRATHSCMSCRGCMQPDASMVTSVMRGMLRDSAAARAEFISLMNI